MDISVVIPLYNEYQSLQELTDWIVRVMNNRHFSYEIILIDDGSTDDSWKNIEKLNQSNKNIKGIKFKRNYGKSAALNEGFQAAKGEVVITMDADLQDNPDEIPGLYDMIKKDGLELVSGWKKKRYDPISKTIPSKFFNWVTRVISGVKLHDLNCGLKAYRKEVIKNVEIRGEMHRYIPILAKWAGFTRIGEKVVKHQKRKHGVTKFGLERFINGFLDLLSLNFVTRFGKRPMHLFGLLGMLSFLGGGIVTVWLICKKLYGISHGLRVREVTEQPLFYLALVAVIIGVQLFLAGFLAELVSRNHADKNKYLIEKRLD